ncbi:hypothetical protein D5086_027148 [Populus alba]|uniref:Uncharacterized protein n=1 Tax=Populus alba TaxID=43335 RepID=A0ACC4B4F1_POPAL
MIKDEKPWEEQSQRVIKSSLLSGSSGSPNGPEQYVAVINEHNVLCTMLFGAYKFLSGWCSQSNLLAAGFLRHRRCICQVPTGFPCRPLSFHLLRTKSSSVEFAPLAQRLSNNSVADQKRGRAKKNQNNKNEEGRRERRSAPSSGKKIRIQCRIQKCKSKAYTGIDTITSNLLLQVISSLASCRQRDFRKCMQYYVK